ncbi:CpaF family protein [Arenibaculum pallidiluteum]|uniref:CpaF family protein n=1 Tax=Arenibaculum pallidiluteum TaxID=2812559 RepID=UPI001F28DF93|nr:CpaF family protein [Arenibaculum pallidiluteum]
MFGRRTSPLAIAAAPQGAAATDAEAAFRQAAPVVEARLSAGARGTPRARLASACGEIAADLLGEAWRELGAMGQRDLVTRLVNHAIEHAPEAADQPEPPSPVASAKERVQPLLIKRMNLAVAVELPREELARQVADVVSEIVAEEKLQLNHAEQGALVTLLLDEMLGLGPLEPLLADETITDIMVNGPRQVYVERKGKLELTGVAFRDDAHLMNVCTRIVSRVGRRVDESVPLCDARLPDGSRVNIIIPPLAIDGPSISIRKFSKKKITLEVMERQANLSPAMADVLRIASRARMNILVSGGTGSGKTTLLNALSRMIDTGERVVTIEDAAELQLQQPHVVRLETRPPNLEGEGEITQRELVKNALRMRPDRIILGEIRGGEAMDMLQAMNTGHDGSMGTIHANNPREALTRLENMVAMTGVKLPSEAVRAQIAAAVHMIVQVSRMRDGVRRITRITEVVGREGEVITTQDLFWYEYAGEGADGKLLGSFRSSGLRPVLMERAEYYGLGRALAEAMKE